MINKFIILFFLVIIFLQFSASQVPGVPLIKSISIGKHLFADLELSIVNPWSFDSRSDLFVNIYDENKISEARPLRDLKPNDVIYYDTRVFGKEYILIVIADSSLKYDDLNDLVIFDTYVVQICPNSPYPFKDIAPEWENQPISNIMFTQRCMSNFPRTPNSFIASSSMNCIEDQNPVNIDCDYFSQIRLPSIDNFDIHSCQISVINNYNIKTTEEVTFVVFNEKYVQIGFAIFPSLEPGESASENICQDVSKVAQLIIVGIKGFEFSYHALSLSDISEAIVVKRCPYSKYPFEKLAPQFRDEPVQSGFDCSNVDIYDDPHIFQTIVNDKINKSINICYDISGKSQQKIFILEDKYLDTKIEGILLDDYYIHKVHIYQKDRQVEIDRKALKLDKNTYNWNDVCLFCYENIQISMNQKHTLKFVINDDKYDRQITVFIKKSANEFGIEHLDISFQGLTNEKNRYGGIIGHIGKKNIHILEEGIQNKNDILVQIEDKKIMGKWKITHTQNCILLPFRKIIENQTLTQFIY